MASNLIPPLTDYDVSGLIRAERAAMVALIITERLQGKIDSATATERIERINEHAHAFASYIAQESGWS